MGLGSMVVQGLFLAWVYPKLFDTSHDQWLKSALQFWAIFGVLAWSFLALPVAARNRMTSVRAFLVLEIGFTAIRFAFAGLLLALVDRDP